MIVKLVNVNTKFGSRIINYSFIVNELIIKKGFSNKAVKVFLALFVAKVEVFSFYTKLYSFFFLKKD